MIIRSMRFYRHLIVVIIIGGFYFENMQFPAQRDVIDNFNRRNTILLATVAKSASHQITHIYTDFLWIGDVKIS